MRLLIIKPSSLGDIIHALVVAQAIRTHRPDVRIDWVARDIFAPIVQACPAVERVFVFERRGGVSGFLRLAQRLRDTHYDAVLDMQGLARSALLARLCRTDRIIGRADAREGARWLIRTHAAQPTDDSHAIEKLLGFLPPLGLPAILGTPVPLTGITLPAPMADIPAGRAIVLFPDSRRPEKEWPYFQQLTDRLLREHPDRHVIWAGQSRLAPDAAWPADRFINLCGRTTLPQAVALIRHAALAICNDSGPMHIAAAAGTPVLALFGPTDPKRYGPFPLAKPTHRVLSAPGGELTKLPVDEVAVAAGALLNTIGECKSQSAHC